MLLFVLCWSCSEEPETTEKPGPHVVAWNDTTVTGDATMSMKFSVGWGGMNIEQSAATSPFGQGGFTTRVATQMDGTATFSVGDLIAIAVTKTGGSEEVKPYIVKSDGSLEYAGTDSDPFIWRSTTETASVRAWSYGSTADLAYLTTAPETRDYTIEADQQTNGYLELLYCKPQATGFSSSPISLSFYHQLSRVIFNVEQELSGTLPVSSVSVGNTSFPLVASFTLPTGDSNFGTWTTDGTTYGTLTPKEETAQSGYDHTYSAVVFPGTYAKNSKLFTLTNSDGSYIYTITDPSGQTLTTSNQYTYTISVKNKLIFKNPLWWVAQYNLASNKTSFVAAHSTSSQYAFNWSGALGANVSGYHLPTKNEQTSIIPYDRSNNTQGTNILGITSDLDNPTEFAEQPCTIGGVAVDGGTSVIGASGSDFYAVRFIGTAYASAWHYKWVTSPCNGLLIESYLVRASDLDDAKTILSTLNGSTYFNKAYGDGEANQSPASIAMTTNAYVQRFLPACGYFSNNANGGNGTIDQSPGSLGNYWSSTVYDSSNAMLCAFGSSRFYETYGAKKYGVSVRLFKDSFTRKAASSLTIDDITAYTYDGTAKEPTPAVRDGSTLLTKDVDYQLSYTNNINAGTATLTLKGIGAFTGTTTKTFTINPITLTGSELYFASSSITRSYIWELGSMTNALTKPDNCTVTYTSSNPSVATVDADTGVLTPGGTLNTNTTITATVTTENYAGSASYTIQATSKERTFAYTGGIQSTDICPGVYQLEAWGAQGGSYFHTGGLGGYAKGTWTATSATTLWVGVGGQPANYAAGGYNGGGTGLNSTTAKVYLSSGGGGTHIAYGSTNRGTMSSYASYTDELLVIGGGGGGGAKYVSDKLVGGTGGGATVGNVQHVYSSVIDSRAAQLNGTLGQGDQNCGSGYNSGKKIAGTNNVWSGCGGTGYVKSGLTSTSNTAGQRSGNGQAKVTWISN